MKKNGIWKTTPSRADSQKVCIMVGCESAYCSCYSGDHLFQAQMTTLCSYSPPIQRYEGTI